MKMRHFNGSNKKSTLNTSLSLIYTQALTYMLTTVTTGRQSQSTWRQGYRPTKQHVRPLRHNYFTPCSVFRQ